MPTIGICELKNDASEVFRRVREDGDEYVVTHRGRPVAVILPVVESIATAKVPSQKLTDALSELRTRIARDWSSDQTGLEILESQRR